MSNAKLGKARYGGEFTKRKYWKLKDGDSTFRIVPPYGSLADSGKWSQFYNVHYGYKNTKGQMRVFQSPLVKNRKTKMVEVRDAALERIDILKAKMAAAKEAGDQPVAKKIADLLQQYNLDNNHYVNAIDEQGNIGILKLRHRAKLALDATIKALRDAGIDPLDAETGRFFVFRRSGDGLDTTFQVSVKKKKFHVDGVGDVEQDVVHVITDEILARLSKEGADLDKIYKRPTAEEVEQIVNTSDLLSGRSPAVDAIFDTKQDDAGEEDVEELGEETTPANTAVAAPVTTATVATPPATPTVAPTVVKAAVIVNPAPTPAPVVVQPAPVAQQPVAQTGAPKTTAQTVSEMTDDDFLKSLGL